MGLAPGGARPRARDHQVGDRFGGARPFFVVDVFQRVSEVREVRPRAAQLVVDYCGGAHE